MVSKHQLWRKKHSLEWPWTSHTNSVNVLLVIVVVVKFSSRCWCFFVKCSCSLCPIFFISYACMFFVLAWCVFQRRVQNEGNKLNNRIFVSEKSGCNDTNANFRMHSEILEPPIHISSAFSVGLLNF